jgi:hypothetical protein
MRRTLLLHHVVDWLTVQLPVTGVRRIEHAATWCAPRCNKMCRIICCRILHYLMDVHIPSHCRERNCKLAHALTNLAVVLNCTCAVYYVGCS